MIKNKWVSLILVLALATISVANATTGPGKVNSAASNSRYDYSVGDTVSELNLAGIDTSAGTKVSINSKIYSDGEVEEDDEEGDYKLHLPSEAAVVFSPSTLSFPTQQLHRAPSSPQRGALSLRAPPAC